MVLLSLSPLKGNTSNRGWPFSGVFSLTKVTTHGTVRTRIGDDGNPLMASSIVIAIRCYEMRMPRLGVVHTNLLFDRNQTLWQPPEGHQYAPVGDLDLPFKLTVPEDVQGPSACHMHDYRVVWRIEAGEF